MNKKIKIIQFNARELNKEKKNGFQAYLYTVKPNVDLLSETWWKDNFVPTFPYFKMPFWNCLYAIL